MLVMTEVWKMSQEQIHCAKMMYGIIFYHFNDYSRPILHKVICSLETKNSQRIRDRSANVTDLLNF